MGKEKEGRYHPRRGKPSGFVKTDTAGSKPVNSSAMEENLEIADKYTVGDEEPAPHLHIRHRNRNIDKKEERKTDKFDFKTNKAKRETFKANVTDTIPEEIPFVLSKEKFSDLANFKSTLCVSAFIPTHSSGVEVNEHMDNTVFKTKLQMITLMLKDRKVDHTTIEKMLKPGYDLLRNDLFWRTLSQGLAVFIADGFFKYLRMPNTTKSELMMNTTFHLSPLLPVVANSDYFYLLLLSKKQAKLYRADAFGMVYIPIPELPRGVDDVVHFEEKDDQKLFRTGSSGAGGGANYHGIGAGKPDSKENIAMYFDEVDETLWKEILHKENAPLLLAGVEYLIPLYRQVAKYKPIWKDAITGNKEHEDINTLYQEAKKMMEPFFEERHSRALEAYANHSATILTSSIPEVVIPAAFYKRVWHLFIQKNEHLWGTFDELNNKLVMHAAQHEGDEDLIDKAVIKTIINAGEVHILPKNRMPGDSQIAALLRY